MKTAKNDRSAVTFEATADELRLVYRPQSDSDWVHQKFEVGDPLVIRRTFHFTGEHLIRGNAAESSVSDSDENLADWLNAERKLKFVVAQAKGDYFEFLPDVLPVGVPVLLARKARPTWKWFIADPRTSVMSIIAGLQPTRIVIGGDEPDAIPIEEYERLVAQFPSATEVKRYVSARVSAVVRQYTDAKVDGEAKLNAVVAKRLSPKLSDLAKPFREGEIVKYAFLLEKLKAMLADEDGYSEAQWQAEILQIVRLLNPKYIQAFTDVRVKDSDANTIRKLDILLVDASGNVDVIEIKKPFDQCIVSTTLYRDNHIPMRELSGTAMQIEKYLRHLNRWGVDGEKKITERYKADLPNGFQIRITNPCGILIMGRDRNLTEAQRLDFEIVRRHYKNVVDIVTYDDLLRRLEFVLSQLRAKA